MKSLSMVAFGFVLLAVLAVIGTGAVTSAVAEQVGNDGFAFQVDDSWSPSSTERENKHDARDKEHGRGHGNGRHGGGWSGFGNGNGHGLGIITPPAWQPDPFVTAPAAIESPQTNAPTAVSDTGATLPLIALSACALVSIRRRDSLRVA